ncbi:MAG: SGNH/GDSL hydrolase family protein, partial [bacterium]|nr:SGNH/GDSL hydrolase family protein [bacterium]
SSVYRGLALFWLNLCGCVLVLNLVAAAHLAVFPPDQAAPIPEYVEQALARVYDDWSPEDLATLVDESSHGFVPEVLAQFRERPFAGRFVNTGTNGFRLGANQGPWPPDEANFNVFFFGGSTALGYGVADEQTVASHLQTALGELDLVPAPRVYNFARGSFYSTQERLLFDRLVTLGETPDLAIFFDGLNDFFFREDPPPLTLETTRRVTRQLEQPWLTALRQLPVLRWFGERRALRQFGDGRPKKTPSDPQADRRAADRVIERYEHNKTIVEAIAASRGIAVAFVWQPVPTYSYDLQYHVYDDHFGRHELSRVGYPRMREQREVHGANFLWCADLQREARELLYVDLVHYSPRFSAQIARCIAERLADSHLLD